MPSASWRRQKVYSEHEIRRIEHQNRWDKEAIDTVIGVPLRNADGKWTVDRPATQYDLFCHHHHQCRLRQLECKGRESREQTWRLSVPLQDAPGCNATRSGKRAQAHSDFCRVRVEECLKTTPGRFSAFGPKKRGVDRGTRKIS